MTFMPTQDENPLTITASVGNNLDNRPEDIRKLKENLTTLDYLHDDDKNDYLTRGLENTIKVFQSDNKLRVDGRLFPAGETERTLNEQLRKKSTSAPRFYHNIVAEDQSGPLDAAPLGDFGQLAENVDATGRRIREKTKPPRMSFAQDEQIQPQSQPIKRQPITQPEEATPAKSAPPPTRKPIKQKTLKELDFDPNGKSIRAQSLQEPMNALKVNKMGEEAKKITKEEFPNLRKHGDNKADAFRHALWNIKMVRSLGEETAKEFADSYERYRPKQSQESLLMDLNNNQIARELALDPKNKAKTDIELAREALDRHLLIVKPFSKVKKKPDHVVHDPFAGKKGLIKSKPSYNK